MTAGASDVASAAQRQPIAAWATAPFAGLVFGVGLVVSGMTQPRKVIGFLDFSNGWDPSLAFVMGGALAVSSVGFAWVRRRGRSLVSETFPPPAPTRIDGRLVTGAAVFGVGWGLGGFCPGPGIVSLATGMTAPLAFTASMVVGMVLFEVSERARRG